MRFSRHVEFNVLLLLLIIYEKLKMPSLDL